ncbi:hypothetical protein V8C40DRAFT_254103 [Trichoderma camerunense]
MLVQSGEHPQVPSWERKKKEGHGDCITASDVSTCKSIRPWHEHGTCYMYMRCCKIDI